MVTFSPYICGCSQSHIVPLNTSRCVPSQLANKYTTVQSANLLESRPPVSSSTSRKVKLSRMDSSFSFSSQAIFSATVSRLSFEPSESTATT